MTEEKKANHRTNIVRLGAPRKHVKADTLDLYDIEGYQVVTKQGNFHAGDLAVYIQPDSVVPEHPAFAFLYEGITSPVPERKRRITVRRFRGEWSEGLLMPVLDFPEELCDLGPDLCDTPDVFEGQDVSDLLGITHWSPPEPGEDTSAQGRRQNPKFPRSLKGLWYWLLTRLGFSPNGNVGGICVKAPPTVPPVYDVDNFKHYSNAFWPGEPVVVTEKIHGSNARFTFQKEKMYAGSRTLWKKPGTSCVWNTALEQMPWIAAWCKAHEGYTLFGEVVPTQGDKYRYGCATGQVKFFVFDILTPDNQWLKYEDTFIGNSTTTDLIWVPMLYKGFFNRDTVKALAEGRSTVYGAEAQTREGAVVKPLEERRVHGLGRLQLKIVNNAFLEKDGK